LASGASLPDQVVVDAVIVMTSRLISNGEGWVLDGFPTTFEQAELLDKAGFQPHVFLELQCQEAEIIKRSLHDLDEERYIDLNVV
jgi:adenylate kinase family enzyme